MIYLAISLFGTAIHGKPQENSKHVSKCFCALEGHFRKVTSHDKSFFLNRENCFSLLLLTNLF